MKVQIVPNQFPNGSLPVLNFSLFWKASDFNSARDRLNDSEEFPNMYVSQSGENVCRGDRSQANGKCESLESARDKDARHHLCCFSNETSMTYYSNLLIVI